MTAVALFDCLARDQDVPLASDSQSSRQLAELAQKLVAASLADLERLREYERGLAPESQASQSDRGLEILRALHELYSQWANEAEQILKRANSIAGHGATTNVARQLDDAIGKIRARLSVSPEQTQKAIEQVRQGQFVAAKELRNELHSRLRA